MEVKKDVGLEVNKIVGKGRRGFGRRWRRQREELDRGGCYWRGSAFWKGQYGKGGVEKVE